MRWLADNHFTFLGYREYVLEGRDGDETLVAVPGTGFGILRADPPAPRVLPEAVASRARDKHLLVLAKANSRATVHRPVHLDYVGVKKFDDQGEVVGERRFSACSRLPPTPSPYAGSRFCARRRPRSSTPSVSTR